MSPQTQAQPARRLLVVDDEDVLREAIAWDFKRKGFDVLEAANGKLALEILDREKIDIVLTDVRMPVCDGIELLSRIRNVSSETPVVMFLTGYSDLTPESAFDLGAEAVFSKPFDRKRLFEAVQKALLARNQRWQTGNQEEIVETLDFSLDGALPGTLGQAIHLGRGGFFARRDHGEIPPANELLRFRIRATEGAPPVLEGTGRVQWVRPASGPGTDSALPRGFGVEILSIQEGQLDSIIALLETRRPRAWIPKA